MRRRLLVLASAFGVAGSVIGLTGAATSPPAPLFGAPIPIEAGGPVTIGDVNLDGKPDLVRPACCSEVGVSLGNGDGTFEPVRLYASGFTVSTVAIGDFTGDAVPDLAAAIADEDGVRVLPGPLPTPSPPGIPEDVPGGVLYPTADEPRTLAVADLATGGTLDVVVGTAGADPADPADDTVSVLLADGAGGFQPSVEYLAGDVAALALADVDGSGDPDIVVANYETNTISVLLGTPSGTFSSRTSFGSPELVSPRALALGDLNGDTRIDLVVGQQGNSIDVFLGNGDGSFTVQPPDADLLDPLTDVASVDIADLNFDGHPEIVVGTADSVANPDDPLRVVVLTGRGDGTFEDAFEYPSAGSVLVEVADLNMDGRPDLIASGGSWVRLNELTSNTPVGSSVTVVPVDPTTGGTPVTITFATVTQVGETRVTSTSTGPVVPGVFTLASAYFELTTTAVFDSAEVCFGYSGPAPSIVHWIAGVPHVETTTRDTGTEVCAVVSSFSPFALVVPAATGDTEPPAVACGAADGAWHGANVSIDCIASDAGSGLADPADAAFTLSTSVATGEEDGDASTELRQVCDVAGNCATAGPIGGNKVDRKAPALLLPANRTVDATSPVGATVSFSASATDGADPDPGVSCSPASGSTFAIGTTTVACAASDHVGNEATGSFTVTVLGAKEQLSRLVQKVLDASTLPPALATTLTAQLQSLVAGFDPGNAAQRRVVCLALKAFALVVQTQSGRGIPAAQAAEWIADANRIRAVLGC